MAQMIRVNLRYKQSLVVLSPIVLLILSMLVSVVGKQAFEPDQFARLKSASVQDCPPDREISATVRILSSGRYEDQQKAGAELLANAKRSSACRMLVVTTLISAMDQPDLDLTGGSPQFYLWHYGTKLVAELKAVEALDLLITNFDLHDGTPFPFNHHPALGAVIAMGDVALPKLQATLKDNPDRYTRRFAVFCIASIGGRSAHEILKQGLSGESDSCVASCIRA